jgi:hypothetical protein
VVSSDPADLDVSGCGCPVLPVLSLHHADLHLWVPLHDVLSTLASIVAEVHQLSQADSWAMALAFTPAEVYRLAEADAWVIACPDCGLVFLGASQAPTPPWSTPSELVFPPDRPFF